MSKTNCECAPPVPDIGEALRASRRAETTEQRVQRLTGAHRVALSPISESPKTPRTLAAAPAPPDLAASLVAARK